MGNSLLVASFLRNDCETRAFHKNPEGVTSGGVKKSCRPEKAVPPPLWGQNNRKETKRKKGERQPKQNAKRKPSWSIISGKIWSQQRGRRQWQRERESWGGASWEQEALPHKGCSKPSLPDGTWCHMPLWSQPSREAVTFPLVKKSEPLQHRNEHYTLASIYFKHIVLQSKNRGIIPTGQNRCSRGPLDKKMSNTNRKTWQHEYRPSPSLEIDVAHCRQQIAARNVRQVIRIKKCTTEHPILFLKTLVEKGISTKWWVTGSRVNSCSRQNCANWRL